MALRAGLSLILPVHSEQDQLVSALDALIPCLESLRPGILSDFEVLLVDNGSTDATVAVAQSQIGERLAVRLLRLESRGLGHVLLDRPSLRCRCGAAIPRGADRGNGHGHRL